MRVLIVTTFSDSNDGVNYYNWGQKLAVFTHVVALTNGEIPPVGDDELLERTRSTYDGPLVMGQDLMTITIGTDEVTAEAWQP